jgi:hypothetical protein
MKRLKKVILYGGLAVLVILVVGGVVLMLTLGKVVRAGVETAGPKVTGTPVTLQDVSLSPFSGRGTLRGLVIGNPEGYQTPSAFALEELTFQVDPGSLRGAVVVVDEVIIRGPQITYEMGLGESNISAIQKHIESLVPKRQPGAPEPAPSEGESKRIMIRHFLLEGAQVNVSAKLLQGKALTLPLPPLELRDIGTAEGGATPAEVADKIFGALNELIAKTVAEAGGLGSSLKESGQSLGTGLKEGVKGLFGGKKE